MADLNLATVELVSTLRAAPQNGSPSSQDYNDSWTESLADLASLSGFINDILIPMLNGLTASIQPNPNAAPFGLEGRYILGDTSDTTPLFFDSLSSSPLTVADSLRILNGIVATVQTAITNLTVQITSLQTQLSSTNQNDVAQALQNFAASLQTLTAQVVANTQSISGFVAPPPFGVITKSASYLATPQDNLILYTGAMDGSQGITFPTSLIELGHEYIVKVISTDVTGGPLNINTSNAGEFAGNPQLFTIPTGIAAGACIILRWDGSHHWIIRRSS